jgi:hypothetical protein
LLRKISGKDFKLINGFKQLVTGSSNKVEGVWHAGETIFQTRPNKTVLGHQFNVFVDFFNLVKQNRYPNPETANMIFYLRLVIDENDL